MLRPPFALIALLHTSLGCSLSEDVLRSDDAGVPVNPFRITALSLGRDHGCAIADGRMFCWGQSSEGALGLGEQTAADRPIEVPGTAPWRSVTTAASHSCGVTTDGALYCWGNNPFGQLGLGDFAPRTTPTLVSLGPWDSVSASYDHTCAITAGELWCWGKNQERQLARATTGTNEPAPVRVGGDSDWLSVSAGQGHTCGRRAPGVAWCWGRNGFGELGSGGGPGQTEIPQRATDATDWIDVLASQGHTCGVRAGNVYCWGDATEGAAGLGPMGMASTPQVIASGGWQDVDAKFLHTCGIANAQIWCWGRAIEGQLGVGGTQNYEYTPVLADPDASWRAVATGDFFTCAIRNDDTLWCTGDNRSNQLGIAGDRLFVFTQVFVP
jgi:alpha-tubulin suppressor-like RCC1 family protein